MNAQKLKKNGPWFVLLTAWTSNLSTVSSLAFSPRLLNTCMIKQTNKQERRKHQHMKKFHNLCLENIKVMCYLQQK